MYINKALLFGNLTRDPELRSLPSGGSVCSFSLATNRVFKKADGTKQEQTDFHNVVVFGRQAETCAQYLKKGASAYVEGRIQTRTWDSPEKGKQYRTEVVADIVQFGPRSSGGGASSAGGAEQSGGDTFDQSRGEKSEAQQHPKDDAIEYPQEDINPDDIPF